MVYQFYQVLVLLVFVVYLFFQEMVCEPGFLLFLEQTIHGEESLVVLGSYKSIIQFDRQLLQEETLENNFDLLRQLPALVDDRIESYVYEKATGKKYQGLWQWVYTNCLCVSKEIVSRIGGFDDRFSTNWGAEDIELGYRLNQAGCRIVCPQVVQCYHLPHPCAPTRQKIRSLKINYRLFIEKHPYWLVELFIREFEVCAAETIELQEKILSRKWAVVRCPVKLIEHVSQFKRVVVFGIDCLDLVMSEAVERAYIPESKHGLAKIENMIGTVTPNGVHYFDCAVLSAEYENLHRGLFDMIPMEARRSAKTIILLSHTGAYRHLPNDHTISSTSTLLNRYALFTLAAESMDSCKRYAFVNLAHALHKAGVKTGVQLNYDPLKKVDLNSGYLHSRDKQFSAVIHDIQRHQYNILGDMLPCFMDSRCLDHSDRSLETRIYWEGQRYPDQKPQPFFDDYQKVVVPRAWEMECCSHKNGIEVLPIGIDAQMLRSLPPVEKKESCFHFLWADRLTDEVSNLKTLLEVFTTRFGNDPVVQLTIVTGNRLEYRTNDWYSDAVNSRFENAVRSQRECGERYLQECKNACKNIFNIRFIDDVFDLESYLALIVKCDSFISVNGSLEINPLVLNAVGLGIKVMVLDNRCYDGYLDTNTACFVESSPTEVSLYNGENLSLTDDTVGVLQKILIRSPNTDSLANTLVSASDSKCQCRILPTVQENFLQRFDWRVIAEKAMSLL